MLTDYIRAMIRHINYSIDADWIVIARIPDEQWYYAQWENHEEARDNLIDVIEMIMLDRINCGDEQAIADIKKASSYRNEHAYA